MIVRSMHIRTAAQLLLFAAALGASSGAQGASRSLGDDDDPGLPPYALQPQGASFEGYPEIGPPQIRRIARNIAAESAGYGLRHPLRSIEMSVGRAFERVGVRAWELSPFPVFAHRRPLDPSEPYDPDLGGGFGSPRAPVLITPLYDSAPALDALLRVISGAQGSIDLMMYGWDDDIAGRGVAEALIARARQGVRVRVLTDHAAYLIHNAKVVEGAPTYYDMLRNEPNVEIILAADPFLRLDHRKLAVIDDRLVWSGGMILTETARDRWHNFAYLAEGPIVAEFAAAFERRYRDVGGRPACRPAPLSTLEPQGRPPANAQARLVRTDIGARSLKHTIYHAIDHARKNIYLENCYFTDEIMIAKLISASKRGVDVRAVITLRGNVHRVNQDMILTANWLQKGGARVYLYPAMTHVKAMSADGVWAYLGTGNFDELSLRNNREIGLSVVSPALVREIDLNLFCRDMAVSEEIDRPLPRPANWLLLQAGSLWY